MKRETYPGYVLDQINHERHAQDEKWGEQNHPDGTGSLHDVLEAGKAKRLTDQLANDGRLAWRFILNEEVLEAYAESDTTRLREELIQVAAVAAAWVEAIDRRDQ